MLKSTLNTLKMRTMTSWVELCGRESVSYSGFSRKLDSGLVLSDTLVDTADDLDEQSRLFLVGEVQIVPSPTIMYFCVA